MTNEEAKEWLKAIEEKYIYGGDEGFDAKRKEAISMAIKALEQEPKTGQFAKWVAKEIFDENWEDNAEAFAEIACRKLEKLGLVKANGNEWELIESQESEDI